MPRCSRNSKSRKDFIVSQVEPSVVTTGNDTILGNLSTIPRWMWIKFNTIEHKFVWENPFESTHPLYTVPLTVVKYGATTLGDKNACVLCCSLIRNAEKYPAKWQNRYH